METRGGHPPRGRVQGQKRERKLSVGTWARAGILGGLGWQGSKEPGAERAECV